MVPPKKQGRLPKAGARNTLSPVSNLPKTRSGDGARSEAPSSSGPRPHSLATAPGHRTGAKRRPRRVRWEGAANDSSGTREALGHELVNVVV